MLCHYDGTLRSEERDLFMLGVREGLLIDRDITFDEFERPIRHVSGCETVPIRIIYFFKCKVMYVYAGVPAQKNLNPCYTFTISTTLLGSLLSY